jgi:hypothetical protein
VDYKTQKIGSHSASLLATIYYFSFNFVFFPFANVCCRLSDFKIIFIFSVAGASESLVRPESSQLFHPALWRRYWPTDTRDLFFPPANLLRYSKDDFIYPELLRGKSHVIRPCAPIVFLLIVLRLTL